jgi:putative thiamine transport system substrate-binding protein
MMRPTRRAALGALAAAAALRGRSARAADAPDPADWGAVLAAARGQTVRWHAWAGDPRINAYIGWAGAEAGRRFGVAVEHVKLADTAEAVSRVVAEKAAGRDAGGAVDLIWINGPNFAAMKGAGLLFGPFATALPHWRLVDPAANPAVATDFTLPTEGYASPWGMAQVVFYFDAARLPAPPRTMPALLGWARANPGRFTYPQPPDFMGTTFLKQALYGLTPDPAPLAAPPGAAYDAVTAPLWAWLDALTPHLWRGGRAYPPNGPRQRQMMADGEIDLAISFDPGEASAAIAAAELPPTVRTFVPEGGSIGNASFVAIPYNAAAKAGAMALADFLLSPQAQARKQDPAVWGGFTVLALDRLDDADRALFDALDLGPATLTPEELGPPLPEPHPAWMERIAADWTRRFGAGR